MSIHERPSFFDKIVLQPVEPDLLTTSDSTDYKPFSESHIVLSNDQKLALMEVNGHDNQDNVVVANAHMNLNTVDYPINHAPTSINLDKLTVDEDIAGAFIANISGVDPDGDQLTYSVLPDDDGGMLEVDGFKLKLKDEVSLDYEQNEVLHFFLRAEDPDGLSFDKQFHVNISEKPNNTLIINYIITIFTTFIIYSLFSYHTRLEAKEASQVQPK